ncbi:MAG: hypothetical protein E5X69_08480 [Mesorhizobium sp.]|nr:MAG: hypothetical protein E5X69_08480 [Mesorhizobium sp.]
MGISRSIRHVVILWRSKERSDGAQTIGSMPLHLSDANGPECCSAAFLGRGHGILGSSRRS